MAIFHITLQIFTIGITMANNTQHMAAIIMTYSQFRLQSSMVVGHTYAAAKPALLSPMAVI